MALLNKIRVKTGNLNLQHRDINGDNKWNEREESEPRYPGMHTFFL